jgi:3-phytase
MTRRGRLAGTLAMALVVLAACSDDDEGPSAVPRSPADGAPVVTAAVETDPVPHADDAADDPAIWIDPSDARRSTIIGTDKDGGLAVYDLDGHQLQYLPDGQLNNVDLRNGFSLGGAAVSLVTAGDRGDNTIAVYKVDAGTRRLENVAARPIKADVAIYGSCMYTSQTSGKTYFIATSETGDIEQWELFDAGGKVDGRKARTLRPDSGKSEGCVADDESGRLYVAEENSGIWRYGAEPDAGTDRVKVDSVGKGHLVADVEGLAIATTAGGAGYLIASSQGDNAYAVYERSGTNTFVRRFRIGAGRGIDGVEETDGIDVTSSDLGGPFTSGLFVAQDGANPGAHQNFKLVPWGSVVGSG